MNPRFGTTLDDLRDREAAADYLGEALALGSLVPFLGAGVSVGLGLPTWSDFVKKSLVEAGLPAHPPGSSAQELMRSLDVVRRSVGSGASTDPEYIRVLRNGLYPVRHLNAGTYPDALVSKDLMVAVGAIIMGLARSSVAQVITLNFDDALEWYLHLHGFRTHVVSEFPARLRGNVDVQILHAHGFIPLAASKYEASSFLVASESDLEKRLSEIDGPWGSLLRSIFHSKLLLVVGSSVNDLAITALLQRVRTEAPKVSPLGFVLGDVFERDEMERLLERQLVPVAIGDYDDLPAFLLAVARKAASAY